MDLNERYFSGFAEWFCDEFGDWHLNVPRMSGRRFEEGFWRGRGGRGGGPDMSDAVVLDIDWLLFEITWTFNFFTINVGV